MQAAKQELSDAFLASTDHWFRPVRAGAEMGRVYRVVNLADMAERESARVHYRPNRSTR